MAKSLRDAIDAFEANGDELTILNATLNVIALPSHFLIHAAGMKCVSGTFTLELPDGTTTTLLINDETHKRNGNPHTRNLTHSDTLLNRKDIDDLTRTTARLIKNDRRNRATKILVSHGIAPSNLETADHMTEMHLDYGAELTLHNPTTEQITTTAETATQTLRASANNAGSIDVFGWSDDMHLVDRNYQGTKDQPLLIEQMGRLIALCVQAKVPPSVAYVLTCGALTALNKVSEEEQERLIKRGEKTKKRPINNGTQLIKKTFRIGSMSESAERVKAELRPMQLGLGTEAGPETMALIARAAYNAGIPILSDDCVNGFNAAKRQSMLDAIYAMWPEATALFNTFYSQHSPVFYS